MCGYTCVIVRHTVPFRLPLEPLPDEPTTCARTSNENSPADVSMTNDDEKYVLLTHILSSGIGGAHQGSDETEIVSLLFLLVDLELCEIVNLYQFPVKPSEGNENCLSEEFKGSSTLTTSDLLSALPLSSTLSHFHEEVISKFDFKFSIVTENSLALRQLLFPEAYKKNIDLPHYFYKYIDLRQEFNAHYSGVHVTSLQEMLNYIGIGGDDSLDASVRHVYNMNNILSHLLRQGHELNQHSVVKVKYETGIISRTDDVNANCSVRARGLPWQASDQDIVNFFIGLNIARGGVALCLSSQGRRNGEALVLFENEEHRELALKRHKHHIGNRYIEVYKASGEDFINIAGGTNVEAQEFLSRGGQVIIRMRGLPYDATAKQVMDFFACGENGVQVCEQGVLFVRKPDGKSTGDAFVLFLQETEGEKALKKHKEIIGSRYIELFRSTTAEVQQVLNRTLENKSSSKGLSSTLSSGLLQLPQNTFSLLPQQYIMRGTRKDCIRLRGLPYEAQVEPILEFLGDHAKNIVYQGVHLVYNSQGQPSGEAFVQLNSESAAFATAQQTHHRTMSFGKKQRYIEVFQCSGADMDAFLRGSSKQSNELSSGLPLPSRLLSHDPLGFTNPLLLPGHELRASSLWDLTPRFQPQFMVPFFLTPPLLRYNLTQPIPSNPFVFSTPCRFPPTCLPSPSGKRSFNEAFNLSSPTSNKRANALLGPSPIPTISANPTTYNSENYGV